MRVCIERSSGKLIESQSGDHAAYGALLGNAIGAGYAEEDVEEKVVTQDAFDALWLAAAPIRTYAQKRKDAYPDIGDQLDDLYHKGFFSAAMAAELKAVKDANPKE